MTDHCVRCHQPTTITDDQDFAWCPTCYGIELADESNTIRNLEAYLECWAAYREWEAAHPVVARVSAYTREDR